MSTLDGAIGELYFQKSYHGKSVPVETCGRKVQACSNCSSYDKMERTECKRLVEEAKSLASEDRSGEYLYRVRGPPGDMRVLNIRRRN